MDTLVRTAGARPESGAAGARASDRRAMLALFGLAAGIFLLLQSGSITVSDGRSMYETTRSIVEHGDLSVSPEVGVPGVGGVSVSRYGLGLPLVSIPAYLAAKPFASLAGARADLITQAAVASMMPIISAALVVALFALSRRLGSSRAAAVMVSLGGVAGTYALPYTKSFFSEPLVALGIVIAIERAVARRWTGASLGLALAVVTRPQMLAVLPLFAIVALRRDGWRAARRAAPALACAVVVVAGHNLARFGDPLAFGYQDVTGFSTPVLEGLRGLLFGARKSVFLFAPAMLLVPLGLARVWRAHRDAACLLVGTAIVTLVMSAAWFSWTGGWSWGPRLLLPAVLPLLAVLAPLFDRGGARRAALGIALAAGLAVSVPSMAVSARTQQLDGGGFQGPSIPRQYALVPPVAAYTLDHFSERADGDARMFLDLWQVNVGGVLGGAGMAAALAGSAALAGACVICARGLRRELTPISVSDGSSENHEG